MQVGGACPLWLSGIRTSGYLSHGHGPVWYQGYALDFQSLLPSCFVLKCLFGAKNSEYFYNTGEVAVLGCNHAHTGRGEGSKAKWRLLPILDLKGLEKFLQVQSFRMESTQAVIVLLQQRNFLDSVDIQMAYLHIPIFEPHQQFLRFAVEDQSLLVVLPFGMSKTY